MVAVQLHLLQHALFPLTLQCILFAVVDGIAEDTVEVAHFLQQRVAYVGSPGLHASTSTALVEDVALASMFFRQPFVDDASPAERPNVNADSNFAEMVMAAEVAAEGGLAMARIQPAEGYIVNGSTAITGSLEVAGESFANPAMSHQQFYSIPGSNISDASDWQDSKEEHIGLAPPIRSKTALLYIELLLGLFGVDRLFLGSLWSGILKLIVAFSGGRFGAHKGYCAFNILLFAWGPWGAADLAVILANALQGESSIDVLGMRSDFENNSLEAAGNLSVFGSVLYAYFFCKVLIHQLPDAKIGYGVPNPDGIGESHGDPLEGGEDGDGDVPSSSFAVPGTTAEVILHATATVTQPASAENNLETPSDLSCVVCCEAIREGDNVRVLPCLHRFHVGCVDQWLVRSRTCPVCKQDITS